MYILRIGKIYSDTSYLELDSLDQCLEQIKQIQESLPEEIRNKYTFSIFQYFNGYKAFDPVCVIQDLVNNLKELDFVPNNKDIIENIIKGFHNDYMKIENYIIEEIPYNNRLRYAVKIRFAEPYHCDSNNEWDIQMPIEKYEDA